MKQQGSSSSHGDLPPPPVETIPRRLFRGYQPVYVDAAIGERDEYISRLRSNVDELEAHARQHEAQLAAQAAELQLWHERRDFIDEELKRVRHESDRIEAAARERAAITEQQAQDRAAKLIEHVHSEAHDILDAARQEATVTHERLEAEAERARRRLDRFADMQAHMTRSIRTAMHEFEATLAQLDRSRHAHLPGMPEAASTSVSVEAGARSAEPALAAVRLMSGKSRGDAHDDRPAAETELELGGVSSYSQLADVERLIRDRPGISGVYVDDYDGTVARLKVEGDESGEELASELEQSLGVPVAAM